MDLASNKNDERDDFWDIESIIPSRRTVSISPDTEPVNVSFGKSISDEKKEEIPKKSTRHEKAAAIIKSFEKKDDGVLLEYKPENPYFLNVRICRWPSHYTFYDKFVVDAMKYLRAKASECEFVPFFSYMPQFNQLTLSQLRYYLWWRKNLRTKTYLKTDYSYLLLYLYEIINLEEISTPQNRLYAMCELWLAYREEFPRLDKYIGEWLCDFCLIHSLPYPNELAPIIDEISDVVFLKEFYYTKDTPKKSFGVESFILKNTEYNYKNSSVYGEKSKELFNAHIIPAAVYAIKKTNAKDIYQSTPQKTRISRDAYSGALCVYSAKRKIDIEYYSHLRSYKSKPVITSLVKYCENKIREHLGIKSRLSSKDLAQNIKDAVDEYFALNLPKKVISDPVKEEERIRYSLYESNSGELNLEDAVKIEHDSWQTTLALIPEEEKENENIFDDIKNEEMSSNDDPYETFLNTLDEFKYDFLKLIYEKKSEEAISLCKGKSILPQTLIDEINSVCFDITGDIIIEEFAIIGDYKDELKFK